MWVMLLFVGFRMWKRRRRRRRNSLNKRRDRKGTETRQKYNVNFHYILVYETCDALSDCRKQNTTELMMERKRVSDYTVS